MKIEIDKQGRITPTDAIRKRRIINSQGEVTRIVDVCSKCGAEVEIKPIEGVLHECSPDSVRTYDE